MAEVKTPSPELCDFLIERLTLFSDLEEHHMMKFADILLRKGEHQKKIHINQILDSMSYLCRVGVLSYTEKFGDYGMRFHFKRACADDKMRAILGSPPPPPSLEEAEESKKKAEGKEKKSEKKSKAKKEKPKAKKKEKCCDDPRPVKNKKTGKRRCKNCGAKLKAKKKKE